MSRSVTIDVRKLADSIRAGSEPTEDFPEPSSNYIFENIYHPELRELNEFLNSEDELTEDKRKKLFSKLIKSIAVTDSLKEPYKELNDEDFELPITQKCDEFLEMASAIPFTQRQISSVTAKAALSLSESDKDTIKDIFDSTFQDWKTQVDEERSRDLSRNSMTMKFKKGKHTYKTNLKPSDFERKSANKIISTFKSSITELSESHNFNLNGAQIDAISRAIDQAGMTGGGNFHLPKRIAELNESGKEIFSSPGYAPSENLYPPSKKYDDVSTTVEITDEGRIKVKIISFNQIYRTDTDPYTRKGYVIICNELDITDLTGDSLDFGMNPSEIPSTIGYSASESSEVDFNIPDSVLSQSSKDASDLYVESKFSGIDINQPGKKEEIIDEMPDLMLDYFLLEIVKRGKLNKEATQGLLNRAISSRNYTPEEFYKISKSLEEKDGFPLNKKDLSEAYENIRLEKIKENLTKEDFNDPSDQENLIKSAVIAVSKKQESNGNKTLELDSATEELTNVFKGFSHDKKRIRRLAHEIAHENGIKTNASWFERNIKFKIANAWDIIRGNDTYAGQLTGIKNKDKRWEFIISNKVTKPDSTPLSTPSLAPSSVTAEDSPRPDSPVADAQKLQRSKSMTNLKKAVRHTAPHVRERSSSFSEPKKPTRSGGRASGRT